MLVVEDEATICLAMEKYFTLHGYQVDYVRKVEEAAAQLAEVRYSVVIVDLNLDEIARNMDGLEVVRMVHERYPGTRIIVLTASASDEIEAEAQKRGADVFLRKPKPLSEVAGIVSGLIESNR